MPKQPSFIQRLESLPKDAKFESHVWVDYMELLCLFSESKEISIGDIENHIRRREDLGEWEDAVEDLIEEEAEDLEPADHEFFTQAEENDKISQQIEDWFRHFEYRKKAFGNSYPFILSKDGSWLQVKKTLSLKQKFYISLLMSSNLAYFKEYKSKLTSSFEFISIEALKELLPKTAEVHLFGANPQIGGRYPGNLWKKINELAKDIRERIHPSITQDYFSPYNVGDKGLDIVAWVPIKDSAPNLITIFGQCACTNKWVAKQSSSSSAAWSGTIKFSIPPLNAAFIPFCFRSASGGWHNPTAIHETILIDRLRFVYLIHNKLKGVKTHSSFSVVEDALK
jgi:hypothetical protein